MSGLWGEHSIFAARIFLSVIQHSLLPIGHRGAEAAEVSSEGALKSKIFVNCMVFESEQIMR